MPDRTRRTVIAAGVGTLSALAGCSSSGDASTEFKLTNLVFAESKPGGYGEYEEQPDATYAPTDTVWLYFEVEGISYEETDDGKKEVWVVEDLTVTAPGGETIIDTEAVNDHRNWPENFDVQEKLYLTNDITLGSDPATGEYTVDVTVTDKLAETETSATTKFTVE